MLEKIEANLVDIEQRKIYPASVFIKDGKIDSIVQINKQLQSYILPGFIDSHIHIESSMLVPSEFARLAVTHGTVATVSDPHEIANVLGVEGIDFMIKNGSQSGFKFYFGASPCVPATEFETSGFSLNAKEVNKLLKRDDIYYLSEMMNFPGVLFEDKEIMSKLESAKALNKPIDGHAPALSGDDLQKYIDAGITTDHEAFTYEEAKEKLERGMKILIREGSAAKNFEALHPLIDEHYENMMFCSDDKHPNDLAKSHIDELVRRSVKHGHDLFKVLQMASINPVKHYNLDVGTLHIGDNADFIEVKDLESFENVQTVIQGKIVAKGKTPMLAHKTTHHPNKFAITHKDEKDFILSQECKEYAIIDAIDGQLVTNAEYKELPMQNGVVQPDIKNDILIISVINRYKESAPSLSFVNGFRLNKGAIASSVAHDSHNIIAVGCDAASVAKAVNAVIASKGGIAAVDAEQKVLHLPLPVAGLMSDEDGFEVAKNYSEIDRFVKEELGSTLDAPFMTLSFMALLVIPDLKLSDMGLFDTNAFHFIGECKV